MTPEQRFVLIGMGGAVVFSAAFVSASHLLLDLPAPEVTTPGDRVAYALRCDFWAALALLAGIARVASQRFFSNEIDGSVPAEGHALQVNRTYIQNTTEQLVLLVFAHIALSLVLTPDALPLIPVLVVLFLIGRATFWAGYLRSPPARAFGFGTTFYPTVAVYLYLVLRHTVG